MQKTQSEVKRGHTYFQWIFAILANLMSLGYGLECGWISPTTKVLQSDQSPSSYPLSDFAITWIASSLNLAAVLGTILYSFLADTYGRKTSIIFVAIPQTISWIIKLSSSSVPALIISRVMSGLSAGGTYNVVPMYVKEISEDNMRGSLGSLLSLNINVGILLMYLMAGFMDYHTVLYVVVGLPTIALIFMFKAPESPAFLVKNGKIEEATKTVAFLRGLDKDDKIVLNEIERMKNEDIYFKSLPKFSMMSICKEKPWRRGLILILFGVTCQGSNGAVAILNYASTILSSTETDLNISPEIKSLSIPLIMILSSLFTMVLVQKWGRKPFLSCTYIISFIATLTLGAAILIRNFGYVVPSWLPIVCLVVTLSMYSTGVSTLTFIILAELFSFQIRAKVMGFVCGYAWFMTFASVSLYSVITNTFGQYSTFFMYAGINLFGAVLVLCFFPETKDKSDEEIRQILAGNKKRTEGPDNSIGE